MTIAPSRILLALATSASVLASAVEKPSALHADPLGSGIALTWVDNAGNESGYTIERSQDMVHYAPVATVGANVESWTDNGVEPGVLYCYRVHPKNVPTAISNWNYAVANDVVTTDLTVSWAKYCENTDGTVTVTWEDHFIDETDFVIKRMANLGEAVEVGVAAANSTSWIDSDPPKGFVQYAVVPRKGATEAEWVAGGTGFTFATTGTDAVNSPTGMSATAVETARIHLQWSPVAGATSYTLEVSYDKGKSFTILESDLTDTQADHLGVQRQMIYQYRVRAVNADGSSRPSATAQAITSVRGDLLAPQDLVVSEEATGVSLSWVDLANNESGYAVEREDDEWTRVATLPANSTSWADPDGSKWDDYRVQALSVSGDSHYSSIAGVETVYETTPASGLSVTSKSGGRAELTWTKGESYQEQAVERSTDGINWQTIALVNSGYESFTDFGLYKGVTYHYRIVGWASGEISEVVTFTAPSNAGTPVTPTPTPSAGAGGSVAVTTTAQEQYRELTIRGSTKDDVITVSDDGANLVVTANGTTTTHDRDHQVIVINARAGNDTVTIDASVSARTVIRGGPGDDDLTALGSGRNVLIAVAEGIDTLTGNGVNSSYWGDSSDTFNASADEKAWDRVHRVDRVAQFWSSQPGNKLFIKAEPDGKSWNDAKDFPSSGIKGNDNHGLPLWGKGPTPFDVNQGGYQNCPLTGWYQTAVHQWPTRMEEAAIDLGDGTFIVQSGPADRHVYARVDGDVDTGWMANLGPQQQQWFLILEKVFTGYAMPAFQPPIRNVSVVGQGSIDYQVSDEALYSRIKNALDARATVTVWTRGTPIDCTCVAQGHNHCVVEAYRDANGVPMVLIRNPYGVTQTGWDTAPLNRHLGMMRMSVAHLRANFISGHINTWAPADSDDDGDTNTPPAISSATANPAIVTGVETDLSVSASDVDNDPLTYDWTVSESPSGSSPVIGSGEDPTVTFDQIGSYTFQIAVDDGQGPVTQTVTVDVVPHPTTINMTP